MNIYWFLDKISRNSVEHALADPLAYLGPSETIYYTGLKFHKRRTEWVGARLAVKNLVREVDKRYSDMDIKRIEILNEGTGAPRLVINGKPSRLGCISISHSNGNVFCAYSANKVNFGVDLELVETRAMEFVEDYFTQNEVKQVQSALQEKRSELITIIWSAKEAVLKALLLGLSLDTRQIEVQVLPNQNKETEWKPLMTWGNGMAIPSPQLYWRREGDFIQTVCWLENRNIELIRVSI